MSDVYLLMTFHSTYLVLECERLLKEAQIEVELIPVPRVISASCGTAARFNEADLVQVKSICQSNHLEFEQIYRISAEQKEPIEVE